MGNPTQSEKLAALKNREQVTRDAEIRLNTRRESLEAELEKVKASAKSLFGTCDLSELRSLYAKAKEEDDAALKEFEENIALRETLINTIQQNLSKIQVG